jgi:hypothetical protein
MLPSDGVPVREDYSQEPAAAFYKYSWAPAPNPFFIYFHRNWIFRTLNTEFVLLGS